jgi:hypothetical protein
MYSNIGPSFNHVFRLLNSLIWLYGKKGGGNLVVGTLFYIYSNSLEKEMLLLLIHTDNPYFVFSLGASDPSIPPPRRDAAACAALCFFYISSSIVYLMESAFLRCTFSLFARLQVSLHKPFACRVVD